MPSQGNAGSAMEDMGNFGIEYVDLPDEVKEATQPYDPVLDNVIGTWTDAATRSEEYNGAIEAMHQVATSTRTARGSGECQHTSRGYCGYCGISWDRAVQLEAMTDFLDAVGRPYEPCRGLCSVCAKYGVDSPCAFYGGHPHYEYGCLCMRCLEDDWDAAKATDAAIEARFTLPVWSTPRSIA